MKIDGAIGKCTDEVCEFGLEDERWFDCLLRSNQLRLQKFLAGSDKLSAVGPEIFEGKADAEASIDAKYDASTSSLLPQFLPLAGAAR